MVHARIVAIKKNTESIVDRQSAERIHAVVMNEFLTISIVARADGRADIEVKDQHGRIQQYLNLNGDGTLLTIGGNIINGAAL
jgi:hypothetical protein